MWLQLALGMRFRLLAFLAFITVLSNTVPLKAQSTDALVLQHIANAEAAQREGDARSAHRAVRQAERLDRSSPRAQIARLLLRRRASLAAVLLLDATTLSSVLDAQQHAGGLHVLAHGLGVLSVLVGAGALVSLIPANGYTLGPNPLAASLGPSSPSQIVPADASWGFGSLGLGVLALSLAAGAISLHIDACELNGTSFDRLRVTVALTDGALVGLEGRF